MIPSRPNLQIFRDSLPANPDRLLKRGYTRTDEPTTDPSRWVWFTKRRPTADGEHMLEVSIRYELAVADAPNVSYRENLDYSFNDVSVSLARIEGAESHGDGTDPTSQPRLTPLLELEIFPRTLHELENIVRAFCP